MMWWTRAFMRQAELKYLLHLCWAGAPTAQAEPDLTATTRGWRRSIITNKIPVQPTGFHERLNVTVRMCKWKYATCADLCSDPATGCTVCNVIPVQKHKGQHVWECVCVCWDTYPRGRQQHCTSDATCMVCTLWPSWRAIHETLWLNGKLRIHITQIWADISFNAPK